MDYYLGLDMGTNSVGWAVTDTQYHLLRAKGKDLWGARLFDEASTAETRRVFRTGRRRLQREKARIGFLKTDICPSRKFSLLTPLGSPPNDTISI